MFFKNSPFIFVLALCALLSFNVQSTIVEIRTSLGIIEVNLFDNTTPATVANFLSYANSGAYADSVVHRSVSNFVIQGGGFTYTGPVAANSLDVASNSGGFTVFGQVMGDGMQVVDAIAALSLLNGGGAFSELPIRSYTQTDVDNDVPITDDNLVVVSDIVVTDSAADTAASLNPTPNTLINTPTGGGDPVSSGGGYFCWV